MKPSTSPASLLMLMIGYVFLGLGIVALTLMWLMLSLRYGQALGVFALMGTVTIFILLQNIPVRMSYKRAFFAGFWMLLLIFLTQWLRVSTYIGSSMGLMPWESALRMGPVLAWNLLAITTTTNDFIFMGSSVVLAVLSNGAILFRREK